MADNQVWLCEDASITMNAHHLWHMSVSGCIAIWIHLIVLSGQLILWNAAHILMLVLGTYVVLWLSCMVNWASVEPSYCYAGNGNYSSAEPRSLASCFPCVQGKGPIQILLDWALGNSPWVALPDRQCNWIRQAHGQGKGIYTAQMLCVQPTCHYL
jgi:hypothetical protein